MAVDWSKVNDVPNAYQEAIRHVDAAMEMMTETAGHWLGRTEAAIEGIGSWTPPTEEAPPNLRLTEIVPGSLPTFDQPNPQVLGDVGNLEVPQYEDLQALVKDFELADPGAFTPTIALPTLPAPPPPLVLSDAPIRPELNQVSLPAAPDLAMPAAPALEALTLPAMPTITVPDFDVGLIPTFDQEPPHLQFNWQEQAYTPQALNELSTTIKAMLAGEHGMPRAVQDALVAAAVEREDEGAGRAIAAATDDFAAAGYTMPPGMLAEQVNAARERAMLASNSHSRAVFTQAAQWAIENLRTAVAQGIALESMWSQHWNQLAQRAFQAAELVMGAAKDHFDMQASAFNLRIQSVQLRRDVFDAQLKAELAKLDILRSQIEAEQLKGTINEQRVRIYSVQLDAVKVLADMFNAKLQGAKIESEIERDKLEGYKTDVQAWGEKVDAQKSSFDAYDSQVRGAVATVQAYEAEARAYSSTVAAASDRNNLRFKFTEARLQTIDASVRKFLGMLQAQTAIVGARRDAISARAQAYTADINRMAEQMRYAGQGQEINIRAQEATVRNNIAYYEALSRQFDARMQRMLQISMAIKDGMDAAGKMSAQMAAGAMSAIHASASISGSGSSSTSSSTSRSYSYSGEIADAPISTS